MNQERYQSQFSRGKLTFISKRESEVRILVSGILLFGRSEATVGSSKENLSCSQGTKKLVRFGDTSPSLPAAWLVEAVFDLVNGVRPPRNLNGIGTTSPSTWNPTTSPLPKRRRSSAEGALPPSVWHYQFGEPGPFALFQRHVLNRGAESGLWPKLKDLRGNTQGPSNLNQKSFLEDFVNFWR